MSLNDALNGWREATGALDWGVQRVMHDTLNLVAEGKVTLVYAHNYDGKHPCLVNAVAQMLTTSQSGVSPMTWFPSVVSAFDRVNAELAASGVNNDGYRVTPLAADILVRHFGTLKDVPEVVDPDLGEAVEAAPYIEPTDAEMEAAYQQMLDAKVITPTEYVKQTSTEGMDYALINNSDDESVDR